MGLLGFSSGGGGLNAKDIRNNLAQTKVFLDNRFSSLKSSPDLSSFLTSLRTSAPGEFNQLINAYSVANKFAPTFSDFTASRPAFVPASPSPVGTNPFGIYTGAQVPYGTYTGSNNNNLGGPYSTLGGPYSTSLATASPLEVPFGAKTFANVAFNAQRDTDYANALSTARTQHFDNLTPTAQNNTLAATNFGTPGGNNQGFFLIPPEGENFPGGTLQQQFDFLKSGQDNFPALESDILQRARASLIESAKQDAKDNDRGFFGRVISMLPGIALGGIASAGLGALGFSLPQPLSTINNIQGAASTLKDVIGQIPSPKPNLSGLPSFSQPVSQHVVTNNPTAAPLPALPAMTPPISRPTFQGPQGFNPFGTYTGGNNTNLAGPFGTNGAQPNLAGPFGNQTGSISKAIALQGLRDRFGPTGLG